jgi:hypothetical protein
MAYIKDTNFVDIPPVSRNIPPNPLLGYDSHSTAPPSTVASVSSMTRSTLTHKVLLYDQRCLVTGAVSSQLQPCHLINTICMDKTNQEEKLTLKKEVVCCLPLLTYWTVVEPSSRNTSSPGNGLGLEIFPWTAYQTVSPVSFSMGRHPSKYSQISSGDPVAQ